MPGPQVITFEKMKDPVVASDGNSYERTAIQAVLQSANPLSPPSLTTWQCVQAHINEKSPAGDLDSPRNRKAS